LLGDRLYQRGDTPIPHPQRCALRWRRPFRRGTTSDGVDSEQLFKKRQDELRVVAGVDKAAVNKTSGGPLPCFSYETVTPFHDSILCMAIFFDYETRE
jgi:hypothetical protein